MKRKYECERKWREARTSVVVFAAPEPESMLIPLLPPSVLSGSGLFFAMFTHGVKLSRMHLL